MRHGYTMLLLAVFCTVGLYGALSTPAPLEDALVGPMHLPWFALGGCALCILLLMIQGLVSQKTPQVSNSSTAFYKTLSYICLFGLYLISMVFLGEYMHDDVDLFMSHGAGFCLSTVLFLACSLFLLGRKSLVEVGSISLMATGIFWLVFGKFFTILLP